MSNWKHYLTSVTHTLERGADGVKQSLQRRYGRDEILIFPYLTYGTPEKLFLKGRVLEDKHIYPSGADDSIWRNAKTRINVLNLMRWVTPP